MWGDPELSVVVLSFRNEGTVLHALASLGAQNVPMQVVLSHSGGGPTPGLVSERFPGVDVVASEHRRTPGGARNAGVAVARGRYVGFLAADCLALPGWAESRLRLHRGGAPAVASAMAPPPGPPAALAAFLINHSFRMRHLRPPPSLRFGVSYERSLLERFGPFREDLPGEEDADLNGRLIAAGVEITWAPGVLTEHLYPPDGQGLLADGYRRGRMRREVRGHRHPWPGIAAGALADGLAGVSRALRPGSPLSAGQVAACAPLAVAGAAAYAVGTIVRSG